MFNYVLCAVCLALGGGGAYLVLKSKFSEWNKALLVYVNDLYSGNKSTFDNESFEKSGAPIELIEVSKKIKETLSSNSTSPIIEAPLKTDDADINEAKKKLNNTLIINELGQKITSSLVLQETFEHVYSTFNSMMDASVVELGVFNSKLEDWKIFSNIEIPSTSGYSNHIADWVQKNDKIVSLEDAENDFGRYVSEPLVMPNGKTAKSILSFPIIFHEEVAGTLTVVSFRKNAFDEYHKDSIQQLLGFLSVALQNAFTHEQLDNLRIRAEQSEKYEQQFLANMSHEIRTPMNAILGMTNLLLDTTLNEKQIKYLSAIKISSGNLLVIINDILDLSKLEAGKMEIEKIPFRIHDVFQNVNDTSRFKAEEKGIQFELNISPDLPAVVKGDPTRLNQIITNLSSNAIKFTEKGKITIAADKPSDSPYIRFRVIDTGIGIPADKLHLLFGNFKQVDSSTFRKYGGTGLGLSISKTLIELQGGKVEVKSELGKGSEFTVKIPYDIGTEEEVIAIEGNKSVDYSGLSGIRVLVAEDNEYNQIVLNDTLESLIDSPVIDIAENGLEVIDMLKKEDYDIILMDAQMPEMDGLDATRAIRKFENEMKRMIPIIALTASVHKADIDKCLDSGMNDFVPKPFTRDQLLGSISGFYHNPNPTVKSANNLEAAPSTQIKTEGETEKEISSKIESSVGEVTSMDFLREFTDGDPERMKKYIGLYLKLLPGNIDKIGAAIDTKDYDALVKVIHAMRPHLNYMGMNETSEWAADIENSIREDKKEESVFELATKLKTNCSKSKVELQEKLELI